MKAALIVLVILLIGFGIGYYIYNEDQRKMRMELEAYNEQINKADEGVAQVEKALMGLNGYSDQAHKHVVAVSNEIVNTFGAEEADEVFLGVKRSEVKKEAAADQPSPPAAASTTAVKPPPPAPAPARPAETTARRPANIDEEGREAPAGVEAAQFVASKEREKAKEQESKPTPVFLKPSESKGPKVVDAQGREAPEGLGVGQLKAVTFKELSEKRRQELGAQDEKTRKRAERKKICRQLFNSVCECEMNVLTTIAAGEEILANVKKLRKAVSDTKLSIDAAKEVPPIYAVLPSTKEIINSLKAEIENAGKFLPQVVAIREEMAKELKAEQEALEKKRKQEEFEALKKKEAEAVETALNGKEDLMKEFKFDEVLKAVKETASTLTMDEYKLKMKDIVDRFEYASRVKVFLIEKFNAQPISWGWKTPQGSFDITGASEAGIKVKEQDIAWTKLDPPKIAGYIKHYIDAMDKSGGQEKAKACLGAAVYCKLHGLKEMSDKFAALAGDASTIIGKDVERVMRFDLILTPPVSTPPPAPAPAPQAPSTPAPEK